jgi:outer membrane protein OmpA-like peptidoglycan-associated protein
LWEQVGVEGEVSVLPTGTVDERVDVLGLGYNVHAIATVLDPSERFRPYGVLGVGGLAALSDDTGRFGTGAVAQVQMGIAGEMTLERNWGTRVDLRFGLGPDVDGSPGAFDVEFLFGFYAHAGRLPPPPRVEVAEATPSPAAPPPRTIAVPPEPAAPVEDVDGDGDGVYGSLDRCPKAQETVNGYLDDDGCPDALPPGVAELRGLATAIVFKPGATRVDWQTQQILAEVARLLREHPNLRVVIAAHADDKGPREKSLALTQKRAEMVRAELVKAGIAEARLEAVGKGPEGPERVELIVSW